MKFGIDVLLEEKTYQATLKGKRVALLGTPASMTSTFNHSLDSLKACDFIHLTAAFGPQHGMRGEKQDNMIESEDYMDPVHHIPVFSLYGKERRPTAAMLETFDVLLIDLQDVGTRVYTFLTTLFYMLEASAKAHKSVWILDRPNPAGRAVEGTLLGEEHWSSFVGIAEVPMRHGLTLGEAAAWFVHHRNLSVDLQIIPLEGYDLNQGPGFGWPLGKRPWVNPSPNMSTLSTARCYPGTVLLEGTSLSEGRGTTRPLELLGAPDLDGRALLETMEAIHAPWMQGCKLRPCYFQPTFQKYTSTVCSGFQIHVEEDVYHPTRFKPYRLISLALKAIRRQYPEYAIWRDFHYEYEKDRLAIDLINGGSFLREWVDDPLAHPEDLEAQLRQDESFWKASRKPFLLYPE